MHTHHQHLVEVRIDALRPTQITVGMSEVERKRTAWRALGPHERERRLAEHWFPAVLGPKGRYYIVDHHHLALALLREGVNTGWAIVLADLSYVEADRFWRALEFRQWAHPYDARGRRREFGEIPRSVTGMQDDPHRGLAGAVRAAGGFSKDATPFSEFLWADYFRLKIKPKAIRRSPGRAVAEAVRLARQPEARYLPGWTGRSELDT